MSSCSLDHRHHNLLRHSNIKKGQWKTKLCFNICPRNFPSLDFLRQMNKCSWKSDGLGHTHILRRGDEIIESIGVQYSISKNCKWQAPLGRSIQLLFHLRIDSSHRFFVSKSSQQPLTSSSCWWVLFPLACSLTYFVEHKVILVFVGALPSGARCSPWFWNLIALAGLRKSGQMLPEVASIFSVCMFTRWGSSPNISSPPAYSSSRVQRGVNDVALSPV